MTLAEGIVEKEYIVESIDIDDEEVKSFLFTLGCYEGEPITIVGQRRNNLTVAVKDARYSIDMLLASAITVRE